MMGINETKTRIALITGASRAIGIGAAAARALADDGTHIFITTYHSYDASMPWGSEPGEAATLIAELRSRGVEADGMEVDLSDPAAPAQLVAHVEECFGPVDILVNNATNSEEGGIEVIDAAQLDRHYAVNVRGMILLCAEFVRRWRNNSEKRSGGRIINMSSGQSYGPMAGELAYAATKGAVEAFTLSLSAEIASDGITANAIDPGATDTGWIPPELQKEWAQKAPMGRVGQPEDAARLIRFLASEQSQWITGQLIRSRGGM